MAAAIGERRPAFNQPYTYPSINKAVRIMKQARCARAGRLLAPPQCSAFVACVRTGLPAVGVAISVRGVVCLLCVCFVCCCCVVCLWNNLLWGLTPSFMKARSRSARPDVPLQAPLAAARPPPRSLGGKRKPRQTRSRQRHRQ